MKSTLRRLSAAAGAATALAVVASVLVAPSASAAAITITPNTALTSEAAKALQFRFGSGDGGNYLLGGTATFTRLAVPVTTAKAASFTVALQTSPDGPKAATATEDFTDEGTGLGNDGPADAGTYDVAAQDRAERGTDGCLSCFTVQKGAALALTSLTPTGQVAGQASGQLVTFAGDGFERNSRIDFLFAGTQTVDTLVQGNLAPPSTDPTTEDDTTEGITTRTQLRRTVTVATTARTGPRDVRITNLDGTSTVLPGGFSVNGAPLSSTTPAASNNDRTRATTRVTFNGTALVPGGTPFLQFVNDPGVATRAELSVRGTVVGTPTATAYTADFDLRDAAPAAYLPLILNADGSTNACSCSFTILQAPSQAATTVTRLDSDPATAAVDKTQPAGTTRTFTVTGTNLSRGTRLVFSGANVSNTAVEFVNATTLRATVVSTSAAAVGDRNVTALRTDGASSAPCAACYTVTAAASPAPSTSPSATATVSPSPSPGPAGQRPTVGVFPSTITAVEETATVSGTSTPGQVVEIHAYSRPNTKYSVVRTMRVGASGTYSFEVRPSGNTRLFARTVTPAGSSDSPSTVLQVRTSLNLKVARTGAREYRFTGSLLPKRPGQLITVFYESGGRRIIAARARNAPDGTYNVRRTFTGTGTFTFFTGTGTDNNNAANNSNRVRVTIR